MEKYRDFYRNVQWDPWVGCTKVSEGCLNCFIRQREFQFIGYNNFNRHVECLSPGVIVIMLNSDFFLEEADSYRKGAWEFIRNHSDYIFLLITKRIERFNVELPDDWGDGYENVIISVTAETQQIAEKRLPILKNIKAKHKWVSVCPMIEPVDLSKYLAEGWIECVEATGEKAIGAVKEQEVRELQFEWVENLSNQCKQTDTKFIFMSCGYNFKYNGKTFKDRCPCYRSCLAQGLELDVEKPIEFKLQSLKKIL